MHPDTDCPPTGLPTLSQGRHRTPEQGACVMEYVSVLAGAPFSDHPDCTHPLLATLAWMVNDSIGPAARSGLARLAPSLIGTDLRDARVPDVLIACCVRTGIAAAPGDRRLRGLSARTARRLERGDAAQGDSEDHKAYQKALRRRYALARSFRLSYAAIARLETAERDRHLYRLLDDAITECRKLADARTRGGSGRRRPQPA